MTLWGHSRAGWSCNHIDLSVITGSELVLKALFYTGRNSPTPASPRVLMDAPGEALGVNHLKSMKRVQLYSRENGTKERIWLHKAINYLKQ